MRITGRLWVPRCGQWGSWVVPSGVEFIERLSERQFVADACDFESDAVVCQRLQCAGKVGNFQGDLVGHDKLTLGQFIVKPGFLTRAGLLGADEPDFGEWINLDRWSGHLGDTLDRLRGGGFLAIKQRGLAQ